jgi:hypothetical protein
MIRSGFAPLALGLLGLFLAGSDWKAAAEKAAQEELDLLRGRL